MRLHSNSVSKAEHAEVIYSAKERDTEEQLDMLEDDDKHELTLL